MNGCRDVALDVDVACLPRGSDGVVCVLIEVEEFINR